MWRRTASWPSASRRRGQSTRRRGTCRRRASDAASAVVEPVREPGQGADRPRPTAPAVDWSSSSAASGRRVQPAGALAEVRSSGRAWALQMKREARVSAEDVVGLTARLRPCRGSVRVSANASLLYGVRVYQRRHGRLATSRNGRNTRRRYETCSQGRPRPRRRPRRHHSALQIQAVPQPLTIPCRRVQQPPSGESVISSHPPLPQANRQIP